MKILKFIIASLIITATSCGDNEEILNSTEPTKVTVKINYNLNNSYSGTMTKGSNYIEEGDSVWNNVFKPAIENGTLVGDVLCLTFTSNNQTIKIEGNKNSSYILKTGQYVVSGIVGKYYSSRQSKAYLTINDTITITPNTTTLSLKAYISNQALIISKDEFYIYSTSYKANQYDKFYYTFVDDDSQHIIFSDVQYYSNYTPGNFYYYKTGVNKSEYIINMTNGFK